MESFQTVPLDRLKESPLNPRTHFDDKKLAELADSIRGVGIIEPIVARPSKTNGHFEIIAGSRRYRAAKLAELADVPVIVRDIDDVKALELMVIENNQREDVNALEEAEGYSRLLKTGKEYKLELLAQKIGRSTKYVYDRLKLLELVPEAKKLMLANLITPGHAILLARLKAEDQRRAIGDEYNGGIFDGEEELLFGPDGEVMGREVPKGLEGYANLRVKSVRELERWIAEHVRLDRSAPIVADLFPETAAAIGKAQGEKLKVIQITYERNVESDAKEGNHERIYTETQWKLADGTKGNHKCENSVLGVIVLGWGRGTPMTVCVKKDCPVHWVREIQKQKRDEAERSGRGDDYRKQEERRQAQWAKDREERKLWEKATPQIIAACAEKIKTAKFGELAEVLYRVGRPDQVKRARSLLPKPKTIEDLARFVALVQLVEEVGESWQAPKTFPPRAKRLGIDVAEFLPKPQTSAKAAVDSKKTTKAPKKKKK